MKMKTNLRKKNSPTKKLLNQIRNRISQYPKIFLKCQICLQLDGILLVPSSVIGGPWALKSLNLIKTKKQNWDQSKTTFNIGDFRRWSKWIDYEIKLKITIMKNVKIDDHEKRKRKWRWIKQNWKIFRKDNWQIESTPRVPKTNFGLNIWPTVR